jgi:hypothetical protein
VRAEGHEPDMRRERRTSGRSTTKSISTVRARSVDSADVHGRLSSLPREVCTVSRERLRSSRGDLTAGQKSAEGIVPGDGEGPNGWGASRRCDS